MAANLNKVMIIGTVTRDPEIKYTPKGTAVTEVGIAVNRKYTQDGEKRDEVTFLNVTLWSKLAELACEYLKKGGSVYFEARLTVESWEDRETGKKVTKLKIVGEEMQFLGGKRDGQSEQRQESRQQPRQDQRPIGRPASPPKPPVDRDLDPDDSGDIPF